MWDIRYGDKVVRQDIPALDHSVRKRIQAAITDKLLRDPYSFGKPLRYSLSHQRSLRVGDYRVLYEIDAEQKMISITAIGHRRDIYEA